MVSLFLQHAVTVFNKLQTSSSCGKKVLPVREHKVMLMINFGVTNEYMLKSSILFLYLSLKESRYQYLYISLLLRAVTGMSTIADFILMVQLHTLEG